jgi:PAS domain S-box-containing protein
MKSIQRHRLILIASLLMAIAAFYLDYVIPIIYDSWMIHLFPVAIICWFQPSRLAAYTVVTVCTIFILLGYFIPHQLNQAEPLFPVINRSLGIAVGWIFATLIIQLRASADKTKASLEELVQQRTSELTSAIDLLKAQMEKSKQYEVALRERDERLRLAIGSAIGAIYDWDLLNDKIRWNETSTLLFGHPYNEVSSKQWWIDHIHEEDARRVITDMEQAINGKGPWWRSEYRFLKADGSYAHIYDRAYIARDPSGKARRLLGTIQHVSDRNIVEENLRHHAVIRMEELVDEMVGQKQSVFSQG